MVKAASLNFALVFGAGFVLGTIRVLWLVPAVGPRTVELFEMPIMLAVNILSARWVTQQFQLPPCVDPAWHGRCGLGHGPRA